MSEEVKNDLLENNDEKHERTLLEEKGVLMLRYFTKDDRTNKILTRLKGKIFFPVNPNIEPGWYIATITESKENHGVMDTISLDQVPLQLWLQKMIKGTFIEKDHKANCLNIYPAIPKDYLEEQKPVCIHTVALPEPKHKKGTTIGEIIQSKLKES
jgi:hypothetical protein